MDTGHDTGNLNVNDWEQVEGREKGKSETWCAHHNSPIAFSCCVVWFVWKNQRDSSRRIVVNSMSNEQTYNAVRLPLVLLITTMIVSINNAGQTCQSKKWRFHRKTCKIVSTSSSIHGKSVRSYLVFTITISEQQRRQTLMQCRANCHAITDMSLSDCKSTWID